MGDGIVFEEGVAQVVGVTVTNVFNAKIVNNEGEHDGAPLVFPEARSDGTLVVASDVEAFLEELVSKDYGQQKSVNTTTNFEVDPAVTDTVGEVVF